MPEHKASCRSSSQESKYVLCKTHNIWGLDLSHRANHPRPYMQEDKWQQQKRGEENNTEQSNNQAFTGMIKVNTRRINHHPNKIGRAHV